MPEAPTHFPFLFQAARQEYRDLSDIPAGERTQAQAETHRRLGAALDLMKRIVASSEPLKGRTNGKLVPVVLATADDPHTPALVQVTLGITGTSLLTVPADQAEAVLRGMLIAVEVARP